ncbi:hypothetical protein VTO42DRAFT_7716 [Malbranchea cinnamomea]
MTDNTKSEALSWDMTCVWSTRSESNTFQYKFAEGLKMDEENIISFRSSYLSTTNYFKSAEWTADGTTVITNSADNNIRTYILPSDLLELDDQSNPHVLTPYHTTPSIEPVYAVASYPFFSLSDTTSTVLLSSVRDHPIRLTSALYPGLIASYSLISPTTEAFIAPHSILYPLSLGGTHFLTGSDSLICLFDVSRPGKDGPISRLPTIPSKRKKIVGGGVGMKGIVSTMADNPAGDGILAAGTFTRHVGLYAAHGSGDTIATFSVAGTEADRHIGGTGITQVLWSPCGRYLFVVERKSDGILLYDIRVTGQLVGWLEGRKAMTNQRMNVDVFSGRNGGPIELWAGGTDGIVRVWTNPSESVSEKKPVWEKHIHDDPISSVIVHPTGNVVATCSGQKQYPDFSYRDGPLSEDFNGHPQGQRIDNTLRIWSL